MAQHYITDEVAIASSMIVYAYAHAFTECDCGKDLTLTQRVYGDRTYKGECDCGKKYELLNGKLRVNG